MKLMQERRIEWPNGSVATRTLDVLQHYTGGGTWLVDGIRFCGPPPDIQGVLFIIKKEEAKG